MWGSALSHFSTINTKLSLLLLLLPHKNPDHCTPTLKQNEKLCSERKKSECNYTGIKWNTDNTVHTASSVDLDMYYDRHLISCFLRHVAVVGGAKSLGFQNPDCLSEGERDMQVHPTEAGQAITGSRWSVQSHDHKSQD